MYDNDMPSTLFKKKVNFHSIFTFLGVTSVITCLGVKSIDFRVLSKKKRVNNHSIFTTFSLSRGVTSVILKIHAFFKESMCILL